MFAAKKIEQGIVIPVGLNGNFGEEFLKVEDEVTATDKLLLLKHIDVVACKHQHIAWTLVFGKIEYFFDCLIYNFRGNGTSFRYRILIHKVPVFPTIACWLNVLVGWQTVLLLKESLGFGVATLYHWLHLHDKKLRLAAVLQNMAYWHYTVIVKIKPLAVRLTGIIAKSLQKCSMEIVSVLQHILHGQSRFDNLLLVVEVFLAKSRETLVELLYGIVVITGCSEDILLEVFSEVSWIEVVAYILYESIHVNVVLKVEEHC